MNTMQGLSSTQYNKRGAGPGSPGCSVRKGLGILEILLALFISGLAIAGALLLYDNARVERMANDFKQEIALVQAAFHSLATSNSKLSLTEWTITPLMPKLYWATTAGSYNSTMHIGSNGLKSPWGGTLNVYQPTTTSGTYRMDTRNMSRRLCHELLSMPWSSMQVSIVAYSCDNEQQYSNYINLQAMQW